MVGDLSHHFSGLYYSQLQFQIDKIYIVVDSNWSYNLMEQLALKTPKTYFPY